MDKKIKCDLVIIDSGNNINKTFGVHIYKCNDGIMVLPGCEDELQHGTAVNYLVKENIHGAIIYNIGLCGEEDSLDIDILLRAFNYIIENIETKAVLVCLGIIQQSSKIEKLQKCINILFDQNVLIVSAMDNNGRISYPAAFDKVIGVEEQHRKKSIKGSYVAYLNSYINVSIPQRYYPTIWENNKVLLHGNSFAAAYFLSKLLNDHLYSTVGVWSNVECWKKIYNNAEKVISFPKQLLKNVENGRQFAKSIKKAIVFPINKETSMLESFRELLHFDVVGWYDIKFSSKCGHTIGSVAAYGKSNELIQIIDDLNWEDDFDTVILGHTTEIQKLTGKDYKQEIINKALLYKKRIYSFDTIKEENSYFYTPIINQEDINHKLGNRLFYISTVVLGIFGTSSKQGKYTLQLKIKKELLGRNLKVCHLATEPNGYLLGADGVFPMGYNGVVNLSFYESVNVINSMISNMEMENPDIIIAGSQSGSIPYSLNSLENLLPRQYNFISGLNPSCVVLCINTYDGFDYIKRSLNFISSFNTQIMALAVLPFRRNSMLYDRIEYLTEAEISEYKTEIMKEFNLPLIDITNDYDIRKLCDDIINYYS